MPELYNENYYTPGEYGFTCEHRIDHQQILKVIPFEKAKKILEIGCGFGVLLSKIPNKNKLGIETNAIAVSECTKRGLDVRLYTGVEEKIPFDDNEFDIIIMNEVIEHLKKPHSVVRECWRVLDKSGLLVLTTPNKTPLHPTEDHTHVSEMNTKELVDLVSSESFNTILHEVSGISFLHPILNTFLYKPGQTLKKALPAKKKSYVDRIHKLLDTFFLEPIGKFRKWGLRFGTQQLLIARKVQH